MMTRPVVDPRYYNPTITEGFARAMLMALEVDPARRSITARALALMLAESTPGDGFQPSGLELLKTHADELLDGDPRLATLRLSVPSIAPSPGAHPPGQSPMAQPPPVTQLPPVSVPARPIGYGSGAQPQQVAAPVVVPPPPMSTLGAMASQALPVQRPVRSRRPWLAAGIGVVAAAVIGIVMVARQQASTTLPQREARLASTDITPATVHVPMPMPTPTEPDAHAVRVAEAGAPAAPRMPATTEAPADARPIDAPPLAVELYDAAIPDSPQVAAVPTSTKGAGPIDAPALAAHPQTAGLPSADSKAARPDPVATGTLKVVILPWAEVWVDGKPLGQTPVRTKVAVGPHRVRLKNDATEKTVTVTVTAAKPAVIDEAW